MDYNPLCCLVYGRSLPSQSGKESWAAIFKSFFRTRVIYSPGCLCHTGILFFFYKKNRKALLIYNSIPKQSLLSQFGRGLERNFEVISSISMATVL